MPRPPHAPLQLVRLEEVDTAIFDWFDRTMDAHVPGPDGSRRKVPVVFAAGERWASGRTRRGVRDTNGVIVLPVVSLRRTSIESDPGRSALGTETPTLAFSRRISPKTNSLQNANRRREPSLRSPDPIIFEVTTVPFPDTVVVVYDVEVQAQYTAQMNAILEKMMHETDFRREILAPISNDNRHPSIGEQFEKRPPFNEPYVVGFFEEAQASGDNFEEFTDQERIVRYSTSLRVPTVLQLDPEGERPAVRVERTSFALSFGREEACFVDSIEEIDLIFGDS